MNDLENEKINLNRKLKEYIKIEKYFGLDKFGKPKYNKNKNDMFSLDNIKNKYYTNLESFNEWVENKSFNEIQNELYAVEHKLTEQTDHDIVIQPSKEQKTIIDCVKSGNNAIVDAVAGSGKTTTVLFIAEHNTDKKIIQITYNKQLKLEVREKVINRGLDNIEIHTYHSLCVKYYDKTAHTDDKIIKILKNDMKPKLNNGYDIVIIDEVQDMTPNYYALICKFIKDMELEDSVYVMLGDRYQGIYEFKNADTRFLTLSKKIWNENENKKYIELPLQESYRVTTQIANFVNKVMLGQNRIISNKKGNYPVLYYKVNKFSTSKMFADKIQSFLTSGYKPHDIFVIAPSLKSTTNNPVKKLENILVSMNIPCYFSRTEEDGVNENVIKGKVVFTTFHQAKGRERKIVFVFGFDESYFDFHCKNKDRELCPSELYVAVTRASEILILIDDEKAKPLTFLKYGYNEMKNCKFIQYYGKSDIKIKEKIIDDKDEDTIHNVSVTELTKYLGEDKMNILVDLIKPLYKKISDADNNVEIPSTIKTSSNLTEDVSDLNGLIIPTLYQAKTSKNKTTLQEIIEYNYSISDEHTKTFIEKMYSRFDKFFKKNHISGYLCMGAMYIALIEKTHSKLFQIDRYDWLTEEMLKPCYKNLKNNINENPQYEQELGNTEDSDKVYFKYHSNEYGIINITNRVDCYDDKYLWEFKCVSSLQIEHVIQLIVYAWIWEKSMIDKYGKRKYRLLNIRTGEVIQLKYESYIIEEIINILLENKYCVKDKENDEEFIKKCKNMKTSYNDINEKDMSDVEVDSPKITKNIFANRRKTIKNEK